MHLSLTVALSKSLVSWFHEDTTIYLSYHSNACCPQLLCVYCERALLFSNDIQSYETRTQTELFKGLEWRKYGWWAMKLVKQALVCRYPGLGTKMGCFGQLPPDIMTSLFNLLDRKVNTCYCKFAAMSIRYNPSRQGCHRLLKCAAAMLV